MPSKIVLKKFESLSLPEAIEENDKKDFESRKSLFFKNRIFKSIKSKKEIQFIKSRFNNGSDSFRRNWFCRNCHHVFHLKPERKYKTLLEFGLICQNCQSTNILHGDQLSDAIRNGFPVSKLAELCKDKDSEMEFSLTNKSKYYPMLESNTGI